MSEQWPNQGKGSRTKFRIERMQIKLIGDNKIKIASSKTYHFELSNKPLHSAPNPGQKKTNLK
jgi:hypothetical protein